MKKYSTLLFLSLLSYNILASPMHFKLKHSVIIDTDADDSDLRSISLLLHLSQINIKAIVISGNIPGQSGRLERIRELLRKTGADTIPVSLIADNSIEKHNSKGKKQNNLSESVKMSIDILRTDNDTVIFVCLGSLTNLAQLFQHDLSLAGKIEEIIWYNNSVIPPVADNFTDYGEEADFVLRSGVAIDIISNLDYINAGFPGIKYSPASFEDNSFERSFGLTEELVAIALANHELFEMRPLSTGSPVRYNVKYNTRAVNEVISDIVKGNYKPGHFVAFNGFPLNPEIYTYDVRLIMDEAMAKHGVEEWKACVMTDEFHGHLGVYSIIGAKMGILAREYFGVSTDLLKIGSYAGSITPFSCMNDGLQVSTGATLGQGTIHLIDDPVTKPHAIFTYNGKSILIKLKSGYQEKLKELIKEGAANFGLEDEDYWFMVRQSAIRFWLEWDRNEIFEISTI